MKHTSCSRSIMERVLLCGVWCLFLLREFSLYFGREGRNREGNHSKEHSSYQSSKYLQMKTMRLRAKVIFPKRRRDSRFRLHILCLFLFFINWELFAQLQTNKFNGISPVAIWLDVGGWSFWLIDFTVSTLSDKVVFMASDIA